MNCDLLIAELVRDEGVRTKPYRDSVGKLTIGCGRNLDDVGLFADEIRYLLSNDINRVMDDLDRELPFWRQLDPVRQRVMANLCFNLGIGDEKHGLLSFRRTLACIEQGQYRAAADGLRTSLWHKQVGPRAMRLETMMETGTELGDTP